MRSRKTRLRNLRLGKTHTCLYYIKKIYFLKFLTNTIVSKLFHCSHNSDCFFSLGYWIILLVMNFSKSQAFALNDLVEKTSFDVLWFFNCWKDWWFCNWAKARTENNSFVLCKSDKGLLPHAFLTCLYFMLLRSSKAFLCLAQTNLIILKMQTHDVNARWNRASQLGLNISFNLSSCPHFASELFWKRQFCIFLNVKTFF